ncbi:MAG: chitooligosaccharide deacetylase NodB-like protein [Chloroflexi bacterium AL-W]|nr:chitooligosaccharide deacetylase NodB-like protein [Chloroflexi bacterium AL-N1]NOK65283.1 chitooligosaccharide deacetylase NodB-like protein [Chloroflexi bacterium AL-N10]NOK72452.1 chitooligosaccharide deacetylase NodB-like protein [Chloroflexi bacterium AL-N5]NOK79462.1 chitooligosaccharide deacetylase NodB-like protein [Chloroflexi bacterium AL-W]NOK87378.1 chitooligosaccharide deacetylase NodB-like protein [Chloroflexi bacterium AL-N15]
MLPIETHVRLWGANRLPDVVPTLQKRFPQALWAGNNERRQIALTFDDGPHPQDTPALLKVLEHHRVRATFFHVGEYIESWPGLVTEVAAAGHQVGIHGYRHEPFPMIREPDLYEQLAVTRKLISMASQRKEADIRDVRPPYGVFLNRTLQQLERWNYRPVLCSVLPLHWIQSGEETIQQVLDQTTSGSLVVLHEGQTGPDIATLTDTILTYLNRVGFEFITVDQMWQTRLLSISPSPSL